MPTTACPPTTTEAEPPRTLPELGNACRIRPVGAEKPSRRNRMLDEDIQYQARERRDASDREAPPRAGPRPGGEDDGGEHPGHDGGNVGYRYSVHERSSVSRLEHLRDTKYSARSVLGPYRDVGLIRLERHGGLETLARRRSDGFQLLWTSAGKYFPRRDLGSAVPADVERYLAFGSSFGDGGGRVLGLSLPWKAEGTVGL